MKKDASFAPMRDARAGDMLGARATPQDFTHLFLP